EPVMLEGHHRGRHRDAALALDRHPVGAGAPPFAARLDLAGELDRAAEQQELLGQRGLAGIGVRDDRESAPARDLVGETGHEPWTEIVGGTGPLRAAPPAYMLRRTRNFHVACVGRVERSATRRPCELAMAGYATLHPPYRISALRRF